MRTGRGRGHNAPFSARCDFDEVTYAPAASPALGIKGRKEKGGNNDGPKCTREKHNLAK
jgi:hypothetical protein